MNIEIVYPLSEKRHLVKRKLMLCCKWSFLFAGFISVIINLTVGGIAWSAIVVWSIWMVWSQLISPDMVEYNRLSQTVKLIINSSVLLFLIDWLITPGWAVNVVPIIGFGALILVSVLFFTDLETQRQNMFPMLFFSVACLAGAIVGVSVQRTADNWVFAVMGGIAASLLIGCAAKLGQALLKEVKKRFSVK